MSNEIANRSHAGLVLQVFEDPQLAPVVNAAWGVEIATLQKLGPGVYAARLTRPMSLSLAADPSVARFSFVAIAQGLALPNFVTGFCIPDPFLPPVPVGPGDSIPFSWVSAQVTDPTGLQLDADAFINLEVRRVPAEPPA